jgi:ATP-dependent DNA helicase RecG
MEKIWKDEYCHVICAFANSSGWILEIGRQDNGEIVDIQNTQDLLTTLPNKIRKSTGITPSTEARNSDGKSYIVISV